MLFQIICEKYNKELLLGLKLVLLSLGVLLLVFIFRESFFDTLDSGVVSTSFENRYGLATDTDQSIIDLELILSGGPGKDGIPSIDNPKFVSSEEASSFLAGEYEGLLVELNGEKRFYPYNILVWHEIVNDSLGGESIAVTFCPLCASGIVFDRSIGNEVLEFGVSGLLYESNLLMYDRSTESLWSQIEGRGVVGERVGIELDIIDSQLVMYDDVLSNHSDAKILSTDTGFSRDYDFYPYGDYDTNDDSFYFPVSYKGADISIPAKELMYATNINGVPVAFVLEDLEMVGEANLTVDGIDVTAKSEDKLMIIDDNGKEYSGYYTMWFSWANHNLKEGVNSERNGIFWSKSI